MDWLGLILPILLVNLGHHVMFFSRAIEDVNIYYMLLRNIYYF